MKSGMCRVVRLYMIFPYFQMKNSILSWVFYISPTMFEVAAMHSNNQSNRQSSSAPTLTSTSVNLDVTVLYGIEYLFNYINM